MDDRSLRYAALRLQSYRSLASVALLLLLLPVRQRHEGEARTTLAWEAETAARQRAEAALAELRTLRGIIPICSYCKRVRAETGDWQQVERYLRDHSDAEFSHGICPNCFEAEAPGLDYP